MTAENATTTITEARRILRHLLAAPQRMRANTRQRRAAARVPQGARWRRASARASGEGGWWRNGRMMKAGTKNNRMPAGADTRKMTHGKAARKEKGCMS